jgi:glycyl-tRNA synthetase
VKVALLPLLKRDAQVAAAEGLFARILPHARAELDITQSIGRR